MIIIIGLVSIAIILSIGFILINNELKHFSNKVENYKITGEWR